MTGRTAIIFRYTNICANPLPGKCVSKPTKYCGSPRKPIEKVVLRVTPWRLTVTGRQWRSDLARPQSTLEVS